MQARFLTALLVSGVLGQPSIAWAGEVQSDPEALLTPVGWSYQEIATDLGIEPHSCSRYSFGPGFGCMLAAKTGRLFPIWLGDFSPCRVNGTLQYEFEEDGILDGVTCGSDESKQNEFIKAIKAVYGPGDEQKTEESHTIKWVSDGLAIKTEQAFLFDKPIYTATVHTMNSR